MSSAFANDCSGQAPAPPKRGKKRRIWANLSRLEDGNSYIPSRVFEPFHEAFPCFPGEEGLQLVKPAHEGILFHRPQKTGTTTTAGIVMRLAHNRYKGLSPQEKSGFQAPRCKHRSNHGTAIELEYHLRNRSKSFLFSLIQDPTARAISQFFHFEVSVGHVEPTDFNFQRSLKMSHFASVYMKDLTMESGLKPPMHKLQRRSNATHDAVIDFPWQGNYQPRVEHILQS